MFLAQQPVLFFPKLCRSNSALLCDSLPIMSAKDTVILKFSALQKVKGEFHALFLWTKFCNTLRAGLKISYLDFNL